MPRPTYLMLEAEKSHCPRCDETVILLQHIYINPKMPMFYICFKCERVYQVGRGEITIRDSGKGCIEAADKLEEQVICHFCKQNINEGTRCRNCGAL